MSAGPEPGWTDERLDAAFRQAFDRAAPAELLRSTAAVLQAAAQPSRSRFGMRFAGLAAAAVVIVSASLGLAGVLRPTPAPTPPPSPGPSASPSTPAPEAFSLPTIGVEDAIRHRDTVLDDTELAVHGFLSPSGFVSCPFQPASISPVLPRCPDQFRWLMRDPEILVERSANSISGHPPVGPALTPLFRSPVPDEGTMDPLGTGNDRPTEVVVLGHFDDHRAGFCAPAEVGNCRRQFVVDRKVSVNGEPVVPPPLLELDGTVKPQATADEARSTATSGVRGSVLTVGAVTGDRIAELEPAAAAEARLTGNPVVWIVMVLTESDGRPVVRTVLVRDGSQEAWLAGGASLDPLAPTGPPPAPSSSPPPGVPTSILGLPVITVEDALARRAMPDLDDRAIAVAGWYVASAGPISCPMIRADLPPIEFRCPDGFQWLMAEPERPWVRRADAVEWHRPIGPALNPIVRPGVTFDIPAAPNKAEPEPVAVVLIGHFADIRAANAEQAKELVVDALVWSAGEPTPDAVGGEPGLATESREAVETRIAQTLGRAGATWAAVIPGDRLAMVEPDLARRAPELTDAKGLWVVHRLTVKEGVPVVGVAYTPDGGSRVWGSNRFEPDLQPTIRIDLEEPEGPQVVVDVLDYPDFVTAARSGRLDEPDPASPLHRPGPDGTGDIAIANPPGRPDQLRVIWSGSVCDSRWVLSFYDRRSLFLQRIPPPGACDAMGVDRDILLTFSEPVPADAVDVLTSNSGG